MASIGAVCCVYSSSTHNKTRLAGTICQMKRHNHNKYIDPEEEDDSVCSSHNKNVQSDIQMLCCDLSHVQVHEFECVVRHRFI